MKELWANISARERIFLVSGGIVVFFLTVYLLIVEPIAGTMAKYRKEIPEREATLTWMKTAQRQAAQLLASGPKDKKNKKFSSPLVAIEKTAKQWNLDKSLKRVDPEGEKEVKVWLEEAVFDDLVRWLHILQNDHGIGVMTLTVEKKNAPGYVDARIVFRGGMS